MQKSVVNLLVFPVDIWDIFVILTKIAILFSVLRILIFYHFFAVVTSFLTEELSVETIQYKEDLFSKSLTDTIFPFWTITRRKTTVR